VRRLCANRPITLNKTLTIDGIDTPDLTIKVNRRTGEKFFSFTTAFLQPTRFQVAIGQL
jgi:hypothetical protein